MAGDSTPRSTSRTASSNDSKAEQPRHIYMPTLLAPRLREQIYLRHFASRDDLLDVAPPPATPRSSSPTNRGEQRRVPASRTCARPSLILRLRITTPRPSAPPILPSALRDSQAAITSTKTASLLRSSQMGSRWLKQARSSHLELFSQSVPGIPKWEYRAHQEPTEGGKRAPARSLR